MTPTACTHQARRPLSAAELKLSLAAAEQVCLEGGKRWTPLRGRVYELLLQDPRPTKAYELMDRIGGEQPAKPPTVYRVLETLEGLGLVHRIASLNSFVACGGGGAVHVAAFMICECCGSAEEFVAENVSAAEVAAEHSGFRTRQVSLEVRGTCSLCAP